MASGQEDSFPCLPSDSKNTRGGRSNSSSSKFGKDRTLSMKETPPELKPDMEPDAEVEEVGAGCRMLFRFPISIWLIFLNELCERFSYYGMKAILVIYFTDKLGWSDNVAVTVYHSFSMTCYLMPILGAIVADACLGRYRAIILMSLVYALGNTITALSTVPVWFNHNQMTIGMLMGLVLIAVGTGGIKPNVCAFGADQVPPNNTVMKDMFFSIFYMSINLGSLVSMILTPILHEDVKCFGDDCYTVAFGLPAALFMVAIFFFLVGTPMYKNKKAVGESVLVKAVGAIFSAAKNRMSRGKTEQVFLYHASSKYDKSFLDEITQLGRIFVVLIPVAIFFMGFDQQGSTWTLQARQMDGHYKYFTLYPDQMQVFNAALILILVPLTYNLIYPVLHKLRILRTQLQKMGAGMVLGGLAFVMAGFLQFKIDSTMPFDVLTSTQSSVWTVNTLPCDLEVRYFLNQQLSANKTVAQMNLERFSFKTSSQLSMSVKLEDDSCSSLVENFLSPMEISEIDAVAESASFIYIYVKDRSLKYEIMKEGDEISPTSDDCYFSFFSSVDSFTTFQVGSSTYEVDQIQRTLANQPGLSGTQDVTASVGFEDSNNIVAQSSINATFGGVYLFTLTNSPSNIDSNYSVQVFTILDAEKVNIAWQIPQYIIITFGEVFLSITGLDFAYNEAGVAVKSIAQSIWLLADAVGNLFVIILFSSLMGQLPAITQFFVVAVIMLSGALLFVMLAWLYKPYVPPRSLLDGGDEDEYNEIMESNLIASDALNQKPNQLTQDGSPSKKNYGALSQ